MDFVLGPKNEWNEGYVFQGNSDKIFRDFFGGDNPFAGKEEKKILFLYNSIYLQNFTQVLIKIET